LRSQALPILKKAKRVVLLTGTPALNRPKEIFTQLSAVAPKANLKLKDFGERYCTGNRFDKYGGAKNLDELYALLHSSVMVRRLKNDVLSELPRKRRQKVFLGLDASSKKQLGKLKEQMDASRAAMVSSILSGKTGALGGNSVIMEVYKKTAELKVKAVQEYVETLLEGGEKFLIFAHHIVLLDAIEHACNKVSRGGKSRASSNYIRVDGSTPAQQRGKLVESFQSDASVRVAILSIKAAGVGLTLTAASTVVFSELTWVPGDLIQAEDRAHRIGQRKSVNVSFLLIKDSIDELIWNTIENKLENLGECLNGEQQTMQVASTTQRDAGQPSILSYFNSQQSKESGGGGL
jgi:SWI/SNF-related matrix-associated actin-dependent regulator 1 of chromatin subfamily A